MPAENYQGNWRGSRRLPYDEEEREKRNAALGFPGPWNLSKRGRNIFRFRRIKHGAPKKFKVLVEDLSPRKRPVAYMLAVTAAAAGTFALFYCG